MHGEDAAFITEIAANGAGTQRFNPGSAGKLAIGTAESFKGLLGFGEKAGIIEGHGNLIGHGLEDGDGGGVKGAGAVGLNGEGAQDAVAGDEGEGGFGAGVRQLGGGQANSIGAGFASDAGGRVGNGPADHALADFDAMLAGEHDFAGFAGAGAQVGPFATFVKGEDANVIEVEGGANEIYNLLEELGGIEDGGGGAADFGGGFDEVGAMGKVLGAFGDALLEAGKGALEAGSEAVEGEGESVEFEGAGWPGALREVTFGDGGGGGGEGVNGTGELGGGLRGDEDNRGDDEEAHQAGRF